MAGHFTLTQLSSGNPLYEKYYRQIDTVNDGRVGAAEAASFLKRSGLSDLVLGKIWDLADADAKGFLNKQEFFVALRLVACAQNGLEVSLNSLQLAAPAPKFNDRNSPLLASGSAPIDVPWAVKLEEKAKYDIIFDSLNPVNGFLSGDKVKPVLLNSKLPVDVLGRVWDLSDTDRDGLLDRDEFAVAMYLVYRALEKEPVPFSLSPALIPPSKRKKASVPSSVPLIPSPPTAKESRQSLPPVGILPTKAPPVQFTRDSDTSFSKALCDTNDCGKLTKEQFALALHLINQKLTKGIDPPQVLTAEMMPPSESTQKNGSALNTRTDFSAIKELDSIHNEIADLHREKSSVEVEIKEKEEAIKQRTSEVRDLQDEVDKESTNLQKLQEQRQQVQEVLNGLDQQKNQLEEELNDMRQKCTEEAQLISSLKTEISAQETHILSCEEELIKAKEELKRLHQETTELQERMEASQTQLEPMQQSLQISHHEISQAKSKLSELQESEESLNSQLSWRSLMQPALVNGNVEHYDLNSSASESTDHKKNAEKHSPLEKEVIISEAVVSNNIEESIPNATETRTEQTEIQQPSFAEKDDPFDPVVMKTTNSIPDPNLDFFETDPFTGSDPFKDDPFGKVDIADPFGGDPFKGTDPFADASSNFFQQSSNDPFTSMESDPFSTSIANNNVGSIETMKANDPFAPGGGTVSSMIETVADPFVSVFGSDSFGSGFADFNTLSQSDQADPFSSAVGIDPGNDAFGKTGFTDEPIKIDEVPPALPPKVGTPTRPPPPPPGKRLSLVKSESSNSKLNDPFHPFNSGDSFHKENHLDPFAPTSPSKDVGDITNFANFNAYPSEEDQIEWAKRESERAEKERLARLNQQEQEDLELAIALSKSEISEA
ncbi:epidermal growth factor receptor substrate 15 [Rhincodon typus]|uniref:epidermal growth factor receptor substrate 15 n=1 Tax=Rhincodon typus TaxID=259920 RepID=UPI00202E07D7|nr:epidermal growth factor receptor substrate 15 [Rhincodon typus]